MKTRIALVGAVVAATLLLAGCTSDQLANDYGDGGGATTYSDDSGQPVLVDAAHRAAPVAFTSTTEAGKKLSLSDFAGKVVVVNFWYATCAPCRVDAPLLEGLYNKYKGQGVVFVGVNTDDEPSTAISFEQNYKVTYPSVMDVNTGTVRLAFAKRLPPTATPTTYVLDTKGRVAARLVGEMQSDSILDTLISDTLNEGE